jgi:UDP-hydrolysing UDP-N-acetyl-D-glucosamine 2-epimerase
LELNLILGVSFWDAEVPYPVAARLQCLVEGDNLNLMPLTCSLLQSQLTGVLERLKPDVLLLHADRFEILPVATTAAYMNIPIGHTEGGEHTGTIDQKVRNAVTQLSDIHFPVTNLAAGELQLMGANPRRIYTVGSTALDSLAGLELKPCRKEPYMVVLMHPNTTDPEPIEPLMEALDQFIDIDKVWVNPNIDPGNKAMLKKVHRQALIFKKNLPIEEYAALIRHSRCLVGNTSSGIKEGSYLGVPYVCIGRRQEGREHDRNTLMVNNEWESIYLGIKSQMGKEYTPSPYFGDGTAGRKIANILAKI